MNRIGIVVFALSAWPGLAFAEQPERFPRFEIGGSVGLLAALTGDGAFLFTVGPRLTINVTRRTGVEILTDAVAPTESDALYGIYQLQVKHVIGETPAGATIVLMAGTAGGFSYNRVAERRDTRRDGAVVVYPAYTHAMLSPPMVATVGVGYERPMTSRVAFRAETHGYIGSGAGIRGSVGASVALGGRYAR